MKSNRIIPAWFALTVLLLSLVSCSPVTLSPATATEKPKTTRPAATPTETPKPTPTKATATLTAEAQAETSDLHPAYTEHVEMKFMGADINISLITDGSLDPIIKKVTVGEKAYTEFMTRSVHGVYQKYHPDVTYEQYMKMVAEVQAGQRDPLEIAIPVYANDSRDGIPYQNPDKSVNPAAQKKYLIIPWYQGEAPKEVDGVEVRAVSEINIALVNGKKIKNITLYGESPYVRGKGLNLDKNTLYFYTAADYLLSASGKKESLASNLSTLKYWMINYKGGTLSNSKEDTFLYRLLLDGGLAIQGSL